MGCVLLPAGIAAQQPRPGKQPGSQRGGTWHREFAGAFMNRGSRPSVHPRAEDEQGGTAGAAVDVPNGSPKPRPRSPHAGARRSRAEVKEERGPSVFGI